MPQSAGEWETRSAQTAERDHASSDGFQTVRLLQFEGVQLRSPTVPRLTFYEGKPPLAYIKERVAEICNENPWLQGRLARQEGKLVLRYPKSAGDIDPFVGVVSIPELRFDMGFADLTKALKGLVVKRGSLCVDKDEDLFRVVVVNISEDRFALVVSISHAISDGHTFYQIFRMLSAAEPVRALIVERVYTAGADMEAAIRGGEEALTWLASPGFIVNVLGKLLRRRAPAFNLFTVNERRIEERKKEYEAGNKPKFITTNDIVASEFFSKTGCDLVFMTVNFRDRIPHLTSDHAGNYQRVIAYQKEDIARPELIRTAMKDYRRAITGKLPGFFRSMRLKIGAITNAAGFYKDVELPGCKLTFHQPVVDTEQFVPFDHVVMMFKSRHDQVSLITSCRETANLSHVEVLERIV
nr:hypothetical protein [uncultured bacterium]